MSAERNLLIEAGAGTGKTTRLVKAVLQALFVRQLPLESIVALTFTNKAAGELKERIGQALEDIHTAASIDALRKKPWWPEEAPALPLVDFKNLAIQATEVLDRANISTIHSYAFAILKRFPLAAGIDPEASIDDKKLKYGEIFREEWPRWLTVELGETPPREKEWLKLLSHMALSKVEEAAQALADFDVPLERIRLSVKDLPARLKALHHEARALAALHTGELNADRLARAIEEVLGRGPQTPYPSPIPDITLKPCSPKAWSEPELERLKILQRIAENVLSNGDHVMSLLTELLEPFIKTFRDRLLLEGCLTHAALLSLSREIVKNNPDIREILKKQIGLILIDEFQDTDPLQAEVLLYLAELPGHQAASWEIVKLAPGKLFIVGDPKQSIYRFRGADIAAYERIGKLLVDQGGSQETLEVNYRSQEQVIHIVNQAFEKIISHLPDISPPYVPVTPHHPKDPRHEVQDVAIWLAGSSEKQSVEEAQATEAEHISRWIKESVNRLSVHDARENTRRPMLYRDVALIFRTYSPMDRYVEALRRHGIPFAVESERYFFTTPEVTDVINLLRAADNPEDMLSLIGFLRSPLGGLTDTEILKRKQSGTLESSDPVRWLRDFTSRLRRQPLYEVLDLLFSETWLLELAARSYHGDQTVANLVKLRRLLEGFAAEGLTTMSVLIKKLEEFFADDTIEGESPLADENFNAVRLLTIHKAKGLEFPVVFLPSMHSGLREHKVQSCLFDWRTQKLGLEVAGFCNLDKLELDEQTRRREAAEQNRILYVAMTRARERLILSGGINLKAQNSKSYLQRLLGALDQSLDTLQEGDVALDRASLSVRRLEKVIVTDDAVRPAADNALSRIDPAQFAQVWKKRAAAYEEGKGTPRVVTPTSRNAQRAMRDTDNDFDALRIAHSALRTFDPQMLGTLVHLFLEHWDFSCEKCSMPLKLRQIANSYFAGLGLLKEPFPDPKETDKSNNSPEVVAVVEEAQRILADFIGSEAEEEIKTSTILGREVPFFYHTTDGALMRGTIDILYRTKEGQLVVGDYKSDKALDPSQYTAQGQAYGEAVSRIIGEKAVFRLIGLREGNSLSETRI